ncbi:MAG TPA: TonB-dependent receptor [Steroidobacteraceae bacterium]|nr:TonB-dependent receptor [Steroidobacteraceae bacterium]
MSRANEILILAGAVVALVPALGGVALAADPGEAVDDGQTLSDVWVTSKEETLPSEPLPDAGSPQSLVNSQTIQQVVSAVGDYGTVADLTPSFVSTAPNGPGFDAAKNQTLRGFVDGQFDVTLDGIPFADPDNFQHHSTSYFPASELDHLIVDRSPGTAGDLGYASFGGSVNLYSQPIPAQAHVKAFAGYGSFDDSLYGATLNTAAPQESGEVGVLATVQQAQSRGAMNESPGHKDDLLLKGAAMLGSARLTALYTYDRYGFYNPGSITTTDLALYGSSYGFNDDPTSPNYFRYAGTYRSSGFGYVRLELPLGPQASLQETAYTYSYANNGLSLKGDQTSSPLGSAYAGLSSTDIAGRDSREAYRTLGDDLRWRYSLPFGSVLLGVWAEEGWQTESRVAVDLTTGTLYDGNHAMGSPFYYDFNAHTHTYQPYAELNWQVNDRWTMSFGMRWRDMTRDFDASVVQNFLPGTNGTVSRSVSSGLPSFDTNYQLASRTRLYAQVARGSLDPSQAYFYTAHPALGNQVEPENALAEQAGIVRSGVRYAISLDLYNIDFNNYVSTVTEGGDTLYVNSGSVLYRGVEAEGHLQLGGGFAAVMNASLIRATFQDSFMTSPLQLAGDTIPFAPRYTGLAGLLYTRGRWRASLFAKFIGTEYQGKNGSADGAAYRVGAYSYTNMSLTRFLTDPQSPHEVRLTLSLDNLWNSDAVTDNAGPSATGPDLVNVLPRRNVMFSAVARL